MTDLDPGDYTLTWGSVTGWGSTDPGVQTQTVAAGGSITFVCTFTEQAGSITVDAEPNSLAATWILDSPGSYHHNGTGDETLTELAAGDYTLTWVAQTGWDRPDPVTQTETLTAGGSLSFTGTHTEQTGSVVIDAVPNGISAPWTLTSPPSYSHSGTGDETITGRTHGDYTLTWGAVSGYDSPDPAEETLSLARGGSVTFDGTYVEQATTGTVTVRAFPYTVDSGVTWTLTGPGGFSSDGTGDDESFPNMPTGEYSVTWNPVQGFTLPDPAVTTGTLVAGETLFLDGTYIEQVGRLTVLPQPNDVVYTAPWHLDGPYGYAYDGLGYRNTWYGSTGEYTMTWGDVEGWITPDPETFILEYNERYDIEATYIEIVSSKD